MEFDAQAICERLAQVRRKHFGPRGKAKFAAVLGIGPSRYNLYEINRVAPADILVKVAYLTSTSLTWLLTGEGGQDGKSNPEIAQLDPLLSRAERVLQKRPELRRSLEGYVELLEGIADKFPERSHPAPSLSELIPVIGSTAAGPARFWSELDQAAGGAEADSRIEELLQQASAEQGIQRADLRTAESATEPNRDVALVQFSRPAEFGLLEFVSSPAVKNKHPKAVAWRLDGDSMAPRYADGDLVITSPDAPAVPGYACVARQEGQIGVNCKIYQCTDAEAVLIPVNEAYASQTVPLDKIAWAYRVLYSVRLPSTSAHN